MTEQIKENSTKLRSRLNFTHTLTNLLFNKIRFFGTRKLGRKISKIILPELKGQIITPTIFGYDICTSPTTSKEVYYLGFYEVGTINVIQKCLKPNDVAIDVGASIGIISFAAAQIVGTKGKVLSFEPAPERISDLSIGIEANKFNQVKIYPYGLGVSESTVKLFKDRPSPSMIGSDTEGNYDEVKIKVLDKILEEEGIEKVKLIKIDVEGFELDVIGGMTKLLSSPVAPILCVEYVKNFYPDPNNEIISTLSKLNKYQFYQLTGTSNTISKLRKINSREDLHKADNLYCFLENHLKELPKSLFE